MASEPQRGADGAAGETLAVQRAVREFQPFAEAGEMDRVLPDRIAPAQRHHADLGVTTGAGDALPGEPCVAVEVLALRLGDDSAQRQRGAARGVDLETVVHLDDLGVEAVPQYAGRVRHDLHQHVDADAHVRRDQHPALGRDPLGLRALLRAEAGRADGDAGALDGRGAQMGQGGVGQREVQRCRVRLRNRGVITGQRDTDRPDAGFFARVFAQGRVVGGLDRADEPRVGVLVNQAYEHLAHAARGPAHHDVRRHFPSRFPRTTPDIESSPRAHGLANF